jgi:glycosyltransferase involved in cell wall biosynthesis
VRLVGRRTIGVKRNVACEAAQGEIVIGWDDDDWYSPRRIARQVEPILEGRADATGLAETLMLDLQADRYWRFAPQLGNRIFEGGMVSGTLAFSRRLWVDGLRYPDASLAEDAAFQRALAKHGARIQRIPEDDLFIYLRHGSNSWRFTPGTFVDRSGWQSVPPPAFLGAEDFEAFRELRRAIGNAMSARAPRSVRQRAARVSTARVGGRTSWTG